MNSAQQPPYPAQFGPSAQPGGYPPQAPARSTGPNPALLGAWVFTVVAIVVGILLAVIHRNDLDQTGPRLLFAGGFVLIIVGLVSITISLAATAVVSQLKSGSSPK